MSFLSFLLSFIPHRWIDTTHINNQRLFGGLASFFEWINGFVDGVRNNANIYTAAEILPELESEYGLSISPALPIETRRANIIAKMQQQDTPTILSDFIKAISLYGITITVVNDYANSIMTIYIKNYNGNRELLTQIQTLAESILRAHIGKDWVIQYIENIGIQNSMTAAGFEPYQCGDFDCGDEPIGEYVEQVKFRPEGVRYPYTGHVVCGNSRLWRR
jgi:hypothetical protein